MQSANTSTNPEPWEMSRLEYIILRGGEHRFLAGTIQPEERDTYASEHEQFVLVAIATGKQVPGKATAPYLL